MSSSDYNYVGAVPASKSIFNRALIVQSYAPHMQLVGKSSCDDVILMQSALAQLHQGGDIDCGHAGTVLRFMALRSSRIKGTHCLIGSQRLFSRPLDELLKLLRQLGCTVSVEDQRLTIQSQGWYPMGDGLYVSAKRSSQFASALLLNAWDLDFPLCFTVTDLGVSRAFFDMTCRIVRQFGLRLEVFGNDYRVAKGQHCTQDHYEIEPDMGCAFAVAAVAALCGQAGLTGMPEASLQPDEFFIHLLRSMGVDIQRSGSVLSVKKAKKLQAINCDLNNAPDLFPVLAVLCAYAEGRSRIDGLRHLQYKESHRLNNIADLLRKLGFDLSLSADSIEIQGKPQVKPNGHEVIMDSDQDHRMAMAAGVLMRAGWPITVKSPEVVNKSFPGFWDVIGISL